MPAAELAVRGSTKNKMPIAPKLETMAIMGETAMTTDTAAIRALKINVMESRV